MPWLIIGESRVLLNVHESTLLAREGFTSWDKERRAWVPAGPDITIERLRARVPDIDARLEPARV